MAGEWIAMRTDLEDDPHVVGMAQILGIDERYVVGLLHHIWSWAQRHTVDGKLAHVNVEWVDAYVRRAGFAVAMQHVGWLRVDATGIEIPEFDVWLSDGAKARLQKSRRQAKWRNGKGGVDRGSDDVDAPVDAEPSTRGEERRGEKNPPTPRKRGRGGEIKPWEGFEEFWADYPRHEAKAKAVEAWNRIQPDPTIRQRIREALKRQRVCEQWLRDGGRYIPLPATYLNQRRWEDEPTSLAKPREEAQSIPTVEELRKRLPTVCASPEEVSAVLKGKKP